jgi:hypothetical protein
MNSPHKKDVYYSSDFERRSMREALNLNIHFIVTLTDFLEF